MDFISKCLTFCSSGSAEVTPGSYAYEGFKKIPTIKGFADVFKLIEDLHGEGGQTNRKLLDMNNIINIGTKIVGDKFKIDDFMRLQP
jgi:hypothetical protein